VATEKRRYRISFHSQGQVYEMCARHVSQGLAPFPFPILRPSRDNSDS
jgi:hypothetical protein